MAVIHIENRKKIHYSIDRHFPFFHMEETLIEFFLIHKRIFLTMHLMGVAVGMGGATITDLLFFNFLRDFKISRKEAEVMRILSNVIMVALAVLYLSGAALFLSDPSKFMQSPAFLAKASIVVVLTINGIIMHKFIAPHMVRFSFLRHPIHGHQKIHKMRAVAFAMGAISFTSWYSVFFIAMLKSYLPSETSLLQIIGGYLFIVLSAVLVSQILHRYIHRKSVTSS